MAEQEVHNEEDSLLPHLLGSTLGRLCFGMVSFQHNQQRQKIADEDLQVPPGIEHEARRVEHTHILSLDVTRGRIGSVVRHHAHCGSNVSEYSTIH